MNRRLRSRLDLVVPDLKREVEKKQMKQKWGHDKNSQERSLVVGDPVLAKNYAAGEKWLQGVIAEQTGPVSFNVDLKDGREVHRHTDQLLYRHAESVDKRPDRMQMEPMMEFVPTPITDKGASVPQASEQVPAPTVTQAMPSVATVPEPLRRSVRSTKGVPAVKYE